MKKRYLRLIVLVILMLFVGGLGVMSKADDKEERNYYLSYLTKDYNWNMKGMAVDSEGNIFVTLYLFSEGRMKIGLFRRVAGSEWAMIFDEINNSFALLNPYDDGILFLYNNNVGKTIHDNYILSYKIWDGERWSEEGIWDEIRRDRVPVWRLFTSLEYFYSSKPQTVAFGEDQICIVSSYQARYAGFLQVGISFEKKLKVYIYDRELNKRYEIRLTSDDRYVKNVAPIILKNKNGFDVICEESKDNNIT